MPSRFGIIVELGLAVGIMLMAFAISTHIKADSCAFNCEALWHGVGQ